MNNFTLHNGEADCDDCWEELTTYYVHIVDDIIVCRDCTDNYV